MFKVFSRSAALVLIVSQLYLSACGRKQSTTFKQAPFHADRVSMVFNIAGAHTGFGDITGPLWIMLDLKKHYPASSIAVIIDDYSYNVLKEMYQFHELGELNSALDVSFISPEQSERIRSTDYIFELFSEGRSPKVQKNHSYSSQDTILVVSDNMHSNSLDYAETAAGIRIFFNPPGIGPERSGLVRNPDNDLFKNKTAAQMREESVHSFKEGFVRRYLNHEIFKESKLGFLYGAHNTGSQDFLRGQTERFLIALKRTHSPGQPLVVLTPNKADVLRSLLNNRIKVWDAEEIEKLESLQDDIYLVSLSAVSNLQFVSLLAASDVPVLVEGNSAVSTALRLNKSFVMYRSPHNMPQIRDVIALEKTYLDSTSFADIYGYEGNRAPEFEPFLEGFSFALERDIFYQALNVRTPEFSKKLAYILNLFPRIKEMDQTVSLEKREKLYWMLSEELRAKKDQALDLSLLLNAKQRGQISSAILDKKRSEFKKGPLSSSQLEKRFMTKDRLR